MTPKEIILKLIVKQCKTMIIKSMLTTTFMLLLTIIASSSVIVLTPFKVADVEALDLNTTLATTSTPSTINVTIGDLIAQGSAVSTGLRVLDLGTGDKGPKLEVSYLGNATIRGGINATDMGTSWSITNPDGTRYSEGQGILTSTASGEMATYTFQAIGQYGSDGKLRNHGSVFFNSNTSSSGQLSFLNKMVGVFADEIDAAGNSMTRIWELK
jgi:hypothetical protein